LIKSLALPSSKKSGEPFTQSGQVITDEMVIDPHCHVYIPKREAITAKIAGKTVYFCSKECKEKYSQAKH
jgi:YHS domain-containing protein